MCWNSFQLANRGISDSISSTYPALNLFDYCKHFSFVDVTFQTNKRKLKNTTHKTETKTLTSTCFSWQDGFIQATTHVPSHYLFLSYHQLHHHVSRCIAQGSMQAVISTHAMVTCETSLMRPPCIIPLT